MIDVSDEAFWNNLAVLLNDSAIVIDRPKGTTHPRYPALHYPLDYGYLDGSYAGDGQEIDVWAGSGDRSVIAGVVCTIDLHKRDTEVKLLLGCTPSEAETVLAFHNSGPQAAILILKPSRCGPA